MKLPFPYGIASQLCLRQASGKMTLFHHLLPLMSGAGVAGIIGASFEDRLPKVYLWPICIAAFLVVTVSVVLLVNALLLLLKKGVDCGVIEEPDMERLGRKIYYYAGWKDGGGGG